MQTKEAVEQAAVGAAEQWLAFEVLTRIGWARERPHLIFSTSGKSPADFIHRI